MFDTLFGSILTSFEAPEATKLIAFEAPHARLGIGNLSNFQPKMTSKLMLFECPEGAKITIFRGPHVRLIFDRQTTDFLLKHGPQNGPKIS